MISLFLAGMVSCSSDPDRLLYSSSSSRMQSLMFMSLKLTFLGTTVDYMAVLSLVSWGDIDPHLVFSLSLSVELVFKDDTFGDLLLLLLEFEVSSPNMFLNTFESFKGRFVNSWGEFSSNSSFEKSMREENPLDSYWLSSTLSCFNGFLGTVFTSQSSSTSFSSESSENSFCGLGKSVSDSIFLLMGSTSFCSTSDLS